MSKKPAYRAGRDQAATAENVELLSPVSVVIASIRPSRLQGWRR